MAVVPLGATEQHGPHLPLGTDKRIACAPADGLVAARDDAVVAPALPYGSSGEHAGFSGTLSIGRTALESVVVELARRALLARAVADLVAFAARRVKPPDAAHPVKEPRA